MSPASKSKSKDKSTRKAGKEQSKISVKPSTAHSNIPNVSPASSYNPVTETLHTLEISSSSSFSASQINGRFRTVDDSDDQSGSSLASPAEYDSLSNNGSCSGESEDQKEKPASPPETILRSENNKRGKIRQKNERKHQRQKERRAQELHERCISFLTSRKLEALSHQLVSMGFPADRATMAIIVNEGRIEKSVAWLLHDGEDDDDKQQVSVNLQDKSSIKIDITDELARIVEMEVQHKCSRQDVERAIVISEGDLFKANENLMAQKLATMAAPKSDESADSMDLNDKVATTHKSRPMKGFTQQPRRDERDITHSKTLFPGTSPQESANRNLQQSLKRIPPKPTTDSSRTTNPNPNPNPPVSLPTVKLDARLGSTRAAKEPFFVMQRPKQKSPLSPPAFANGGMGMNGSNVQQFYPRNNLQQMLSVPTDLSASAGWSGRPQNVPGTISSPLATPASLGLYAGWGSSAFSKPSSQNDWNACGSTPHRDYTSIDWSLDPAPRKPSTKIDVVSGTWSTMFMGGNATRPLRNGGGGVHLPGLQEVSSFLSDHPASGSSQEWTNPFEGRDLFRVPRQYVTFPSM